MKKLFLSILLSFIMLSKGEELSLKEILKKSAEAYHSLNSYKSSGTVTANLNGNTIALNLL